MSRVRCRIGRACCARRWLVVVIWLVLLIAAGAGVKIGWDQLVNAFITPASPSQRDGWIIPCSINPESPVTCRTCVVYSSGELVHWRRGADHSPCLPGGPIIYTPGG